MNDADALIFRWTSQHDTDAIRRQALDRELVADYVSDARDRRRGDRRRRSRKVRDVFAAVFVSVIGVAMFFGLIFGWFSGHGR